MGIEENKALIHRLHELYSRHELDAAAEIYAPGCFESLTWEQNKNVDTMLLNALPDLKITILDMIAEGDKVAFINNVTGTHTGGPLWGFPPTGKKMDCKNTRIVKIVDNKIVEFKGTGDWLSTLQQVGVLPPLNAQFSPQWRKIYQVTNDPLK